MLDALRAPIVQGPMSGGPSTVALAFAVGEAGGLGFLAAGYRTADQLDADIGELAAATTVPFGVNLFACRPTALSAGDELRLGEYAERIRPEATALGVELGSPRADDDGFEAKLEVVLRARPAVVSFAFGCPPPKTLADLTRAGIEAWVTITEPGEAELAAASGAAALVVSGVEAGGHRSTFDDADGEGEVGLLPLLARVRRAVSLPLVAAGGLATPESVRAVLAAGAGAAQAGTAFLDTVEAGTSETHRRALNGSQPTALTRAFTGRRARGIVNRFMTEHGPAAPAAYPQIHHLTAPLRAAARAAARADAVSLWAGQAYPLIDHGVPAAAVVARLDPRQA